MSRFRFDGLTPLWSEWQGLFDDESEPQLLATATSIVEELSLPDNPARGDRRRPAPGVDASGNEQSIAELIAIVRHRYVHIYFDWLSRVMPDTGSWKPTRQAWVAGPTEIPSEIRDGSYQRLWGKSRGNPGFFNTIHDEHYPPLGSPPLIDLYAAIYRWWRTHIGRPFRPNLSQTGIGEGESYREILDQLNPAARFLLRIVWAVDDRYTEAHCASVATEYARRQSRF